MTRKRPDVQLCGERHERYIHCMICNPPPPELPGRLQGPEVGARVVYHSKYPRHDGETATVTERSYVWAPGDPAYHGGARRYDWKVIRFDSGTSLCVDDKDLTPLGEQAWYDHMADLITRDVYNAAEDERITKLIEGK